MEFNSLIAQPVVGGQVTQIANTVLGRMQQTSVCPRVMVTAKS